LRYLSSDAYFSACGQYRYWLARRLSMGERAIAFVGVNPSTADATLDDPTIRRCVGFARRWGYDWYYMLNVCAYRSTDVRALKRVDDPIGPLNWEYMTSIMGKCEVVVAAWGRTVKLPNATARTYAARILDRSETRCLGQNDDGSPKHPLYIPYEQPLLSVTRSA
jgi:hypothetical protein